MTTLPVPKIYWDIFQNALQAKMKKLAKDVAASLGQVDKPLLSALISEKTNVYLFEEDGSEYIDVKSMRCTYSVPTPENNAVLCACHKPVLLGSSSCLYHEGLQQETKVNLIELRKITDETGNIYWLDKDNAIRDKMNPSIAEGFYDEKDGRLCIFKKTS